MFWPAPPGHGCAPHACARTITWAADAAARAIRNARAVLAPAPVTVNDFFIACSVGMYECASQNRGERGGADRDGETSSEKPGALPSSYPTLRRADRAGSAGL